MLSAAYYEEYSACHYYDTCCVEDCCTDATGGWKDCTGRVDNLYTTAYILCSIVRVCSGDSGNRHLSCSMMALISFSLPMDL